MVAIHALLLRNSNHARFQAVPSIAKFPIGVTSHPAQIRVAFAYLTSAQELLLPLQQMVVLLARTLLTLFNVPAIPALSTVSYHLGMLGVIAHRHVVLELDKELETSLLPPSIMVLVAITLSIPVLVL